MEYLADNISSGDEFTFIIIVSDIILGAYQNSLEFKLNLITALNLIITISCDKINRYYKKYSLHMK